jgi:hypothetical protein
LEVSALSLEQHPSVGFGASSAGEIINFLDKEWEDSNKKIFL